MKSAANCPALYTPRTLDEQGRKGDKGDKCVRISSVSLRVAHEPRAGYPLALRQGLKLLFDVYIVIPIAWAWPSYLK